MREDCYTMKEVPAFEYKQFIHFYQRISPSKRMKYKRQGDRIVVRSKDQKMVCIEHHFLGMQKYEIEEGWYKKFKARWRYEQ